MEVTSNTLSAGGGSFGGDLSISDTDFDLGSLDSLSLDSALDLPDLSLPDFGDLPDIGSPEISGLSDLSSIPDLSNLDPVAQGEALRSYDAITGSQETTDNLLAGTTPAPPQIDPASAFPQTPEAPEIVVTADPVLTHLLSPEIMSASTFALYERDDNALRAARDDAFDLTGVNYSIVEQERQMATEYIYMGDFAQLREFTPANFYAGDRPQPGGLEDLAGKVWAAPVTVPAAVVGAANVGLGALAGNENAGIQFGDNAIQFVGGAFGQGGTLGWGGDGAVTLGNTQLYAGNVTPDTRDSGYDRTQAPVRVGDHEEGHTYQYQSEGVFFFPSYLPQGLQNGATPYEQAAAAAARGGSPYPPEAFNPN